METVGTTGAGVTRNKVMDFLVSHLFDLAKILTVFTYMRSSVVRVSVLFCIN